MAIDPLLIEKIKTTLGISQSSAYRKIAEVADELTEDNAIGALELARRNGIPYRRFATEPQLQRLREAAKSHLPAIPASTVATTGPTGTSRATRPARKSGKSKAKKPGNHGVWIVFGRDRRMQTAMATFVQSIGLKNYEWSQAVKDTKSGAPYVGHVLDEAFKKASAVIVLLTPDDVAKLKKPHWNKHDESYERKLTGQARPNVIFEAGIATALFPSRTVFVEFGKCRPFSDTAGKLAIRMSNSVESRRELADRLAGAGLAVNLSGTHWMNAGDFSAPK